VSEGSVVSGALGSENPEAAPDSFAARDPLRMIETVGRVLARNKLDDPARSHGRALRAVADFHGASLTAVLRFEDEGAHVVGIWASGRFERDPQIVVGRDFLADDPGWRSNRNCRVIEPSDLQADFAELLEEIGPGQSLRVVPIVDRDEVRGALVVLAPGVGPVDRREAIALKLCGEVLWRAIRHHERRRELQERAEVAEILADIGRSLHEAGMDEARVMFDDVLSTVGAYLGADMASADRIVADQLRPAGRWAADGVALHERERDVPADIGRLADVEVEEFNELCASSFAPVLAEGMRSGLIIAGHEGGSLAGVVVIARRENRAFRATQVELASGAVRLLCRFQRRMVAEASLVRRGQVDQARTEIAESFLNTSATEIDESVHSALARIGSVFGARRVRWVEMDDVGQSAALTLEWHDGSRPDAPTDWSLGSGLADLRATVREPILFDPAMVAELCGTRSPSSTLVVPAVVGDDVRAVLTLTADAIGDDMPDDERRSLTDLAGLILQARQRARQEQEVEYRQRLDDLQLRLATRFLDRGVVDSGPVLDWVLGEVGSVLSADLIGFLEHLGSSRGEMRWWTKDENAARAADHMDVGSDGFARYFDTILKSGEPRTSRSRLMPPEVRERAEDATGSEFSTLVVPLRAPGIALMLGVSVFRDHEWSAAERAFLQQVIGQIRQFIDVVASRGQLEHDASHDSLTGLANRRKLTEELRALLDGGDSGAVLMIDVDRFKVVNDSLGHSAGDVVLVTIADRISATIRGGDLVSRFGGDEFAVLVRGETAELELAATADRLISVIRQPVVVRGTTVIPTCSVGIALSGAGDDVELVLGHADAALYDAKAKGRDRYEFFDEAHRQSLRERLHLETALRRGLLGDEFLPWFQPEYDLMGGEIVGVEALVRWDHPSRGVLEASRFIDTAEEIGLAPEMSRLVLERSFDALRTWRAEGLETRIRVNIAAAQLQSCDLVAEIAEGLDRFSIPAEMLCIEITERSLMLDLDTAVDVLGQVRDLGVEVAVDDFGTGFSSLARLKHLPVDTLKVDRSFVNGIVSSATDREIVRTIIWLSRGLGLGVVAEGVEHPAQAEMLLELGCRRAQGWLWSAAVPAADVPRLVRGSCRPATRR
jgi:diguanylate cyclase (GGDEF)-like protein